MPAARNRKLCYLSIAILFSFELLGDPLKPKDTLSQKSNCRRLIVDSALETSGAPVDELNGTLCLDGGHGCVHILWHHISLHTGMLRFIALLRGTPKLQNVPTLSRQIYDFSVGTSLDTLAGKYIGNLRAPVPLYVVFIQHTMHHMCLRCLPTHIIGCSHC